MAARRAERRVCDSRGARSGERGGGRGRACWAGRRRPGPAASGMRLRTGAVRQQEAAAATRPPPRAPTMAGGASRPVCRRRAWRPTAERPPGAPPAAQPLAAPPPPSYCPGGPRRARCAARAGLCRLVSGSERRMEDCARRWVCCTGGGCANCSPGALSEASAPARPRQKSHVLSFWMQRSNTGLTRTDQRQGPISSCLTTSQG